MHVTQTGKFHYEIKSETKILTTKDIVSFSLHLCVCLAFEISVHSADSADWCQRKL